jgi:hypothetical protein
MNQVAPLPHWLPIETELSCAICQAKCKGNKHHGGCSNRPYDDGVEAGLGPLVGAGQVTGKSAPTDYGDAYYNRCQALPQAKVNSQQRQKKQPQDSAAKNS